MSAETTDWLTQEVRDLLDVSSVGLYEFLDLLRKPELELSTDERQQVARQALERLMAEPGMRLERLRWPNWEHLGNLRLDELPADLWHPPDEDGIYLAIDRAPSS
jgi:hypothetical protein